MDRIPSIYDYLGQGIDQGTQNFVQGQQRQLENKYQQLGFMNNLYASGAIPADSFSQALKQSGVPGLSGVNIMPSKQERMNNLISAAPPDVKSDLQYSSVGLTPPEDVRVNRNLKSSQAKEAGARADLATTQATEYSDNANSRRALTAAEVGDKKAKLYQDTANRYVSGQLSATGGRINPANLPAVSLAALNQYLKDHTAAGMGTEDNPAEIKAYFDQAAQNALLEQRKMDIQASYASDRVTPEDRMFQRLSVVEDNAAKHADELLRTAAGAGASLFLDKDLSTVPANFQGIVKQWQETQGLRVRLRKAMATLDPKDIKDALTSATAAQPTGGAAVISDRPKAELDQLRKTIRQLPEGMRAEYVQRKKALLSDNDYKKIASEFGVQP